MSNYIWRRGHFDFNTDLVARGCGNLPAWCAGDPTLFFEASDRFERRNGSACRHLVIALPRELDLDGWMRLVESFVVHEVGTKPFQWAIHWKRTESGDHPHAHVLYSDRLPDGIDRPAELFFRRPNATSPELGGCKKDSGGRSPKQLRIEVITRKKRWADLQNQELAAAGSSARVDYKCEEDLTLN